METEVLTETIDYIDVTGYVPTMLDFSPMRLSGEQFDSLAINHPDLNIELSAEGELIILAPTSLNSGWKNADLITDLTIWARRDKSGIVFDSSSLFTFRNGAKRSPDAAWCKNEKWDTLPDSEKDAFSRLVPDFVVELRSKTDRLGTLRKKMEEYISSGVRLAWLIDPIKRQVYIYRADGRVEVLDDPAIVSGEDVLPGFELDARELW